jgi:acyl-CoA thioester hydrolase
VYTYTYRHRVRYRECDPMGVVYHTHYLDFFEYARTEALREMGLAYKRLEDQGIIMPVIDLGMEFKAPAHYDDVLEITAFFAEVPRVRVPVTYEVRRVVDEALIATGHVTLCFVDTARNRPVVAPDAVRTLFESALPDAA